MLARSTILSQMSGSLYGSVYARNRGGLYARNRTKPVNPNTPEQAAVRATFAEVAREWVIGLDDDTRAAWNAYAAGTTVINRLGEATHLSGQQMFISRISARLMAGLA